MSVAEPAWLRLQELLKQRLCLQPRFDLEPPDFFPDLGERIEPRPPLRLAGRMGV
jgi:hypothetical protein